MTKTSLNSFGAKQTLDVNGKSYTYYSLSAAQKNGLSGISRLPNSLKVVLENLLRFEDGTTVTKQDIDRISRRSRNGWPPEPRPMKSPIARPGC